MQLSGLVGSTKGGAVGERFMHSQTHDLTLACARLPQPHQPIIASLVRAMPAHTA